MNVAETVSIITPAYKAGRFIDDAIRSVVAQDYASWEMLIVDDCSPDNTVEVIQAWLTRDSRIRLIRQPVNAGPAAARNAALEKSSGRYVAFLDSDDLWLSGKLSRQLEFMHANNAPISFTGFRRISEDSSQTGRLLRVPAMITYSQLLGNTAIATSTVIIDRSLTGPIHMCSVYYDDFALWLSLLRQGHTAFGFDEDLMRYRVVGKSVSRNKTKSAWEVWKTYRDLEGLSLPRSLWSFLNYSLRGWLKYSRF